MTLQYTTNGAPLRGTGLCDATAAQRGKGAVMVNDLFPETKPPRAKPRVMAHVFDAGCSCETELARFECKRCGWQSDWLSVASISEGKRGVPCPKCNQGAPHE